MSLCEELDTNWSGDHGSPHLQTRGQQPPDLVLYSSCLWHSCQAVVTALPALKRVHLPCSIQSSTEMSCRSCPCLQEKLVQGDAYLYDVSHFLEMHRPTPAGEDPIDVNLSRTPPVPQAQLDVYLEHNRHYTNGQRHMASPQRHGDAAGSSGGDEAESHITLNARYKGAWGCKAL